MALRPDRVIEMSDALHTMGAVASKGVVLCFNASASGVALGDSHGTLQLGASASGLKPAGVLLTDVVNIDETRYHTNYFKEEVNIGDPVEILTRGWVITDKVTGSPSEGNKAYLTANGVVTPTSLGAAATPLVGEFGGSIDELGFVKLKINLPNGA